MPTNYAENAHKVLQKKISPSSRIVGMYYVILIGKRGEWDAHWDFLVMPRKEETHFRISNITLPTAFSAFLEILCAEQDVEYVQ